MCASMPVCVGVWVHVCVCVCVWVWVDVCGLCWQSPKTWRKKFFKSVAHIFILDKIILLHIKYLKVLNSCLSLLS